MMIEQLTPAILASMVTTIIISTFGDPYRNKNGQYRTSKQGFIMWIIILGASSAANKFISDWIETNITPIGFMIFIFIGHIIYKNFVDERH
jgi:hypothetical protein